MAMDGVVPTLRPAWWRSLARQAGLAALCSCVVLVVACNGGVNTLERGFTHQYGLLPGRTAVFWRAVSPVHNPGVSAVSLEDQAGSQTWIRSVRDLIDAGVSIRSEADAVAYSDLIREFGLYGDAPGQPLHFRSEPGGEPRSFGAADASRWNVPPEVVVEADGAGYTLRRPVVLPAGVESLHGVTGIPAVVLGEERIGVDGAYEFRVRRVLESGSQVLEYAVMLR